MIIGVIKGVYGLGRRVWGSGFRAWSSGLMSSGFGVRVGAILGLYGGCCVVLGFLGKASSQRFGAEARLGQGVLIMQAPIGS